MRCLPAARRRRTGAPPSARLLHPCAEAELYNALQAREVMVELKPRVDGFELDFGLHNPAGRVDIACVGIHHLDARGRQRRQDLARDAILERSGRSVLHHPSWRCLTDPVDVANDIPQD